MAFYEWSPLIKKTNSREGYKAGDTIFYPSIDKKKNLILMKCTIMHIEYDYYAPRTEFEHPVAVCKKKAGLFGLRTEFMEVPFYLMSKDINEARALFMKNSKYLKNIKIRSKL